MTAILYGKPRKIGEAYDERRRLIAVAYEQPDGQIVTFGDRAASSKILRDHNLPDIMSTHKNELWVALLVLATVAALGLVALRLLEWAGWL